MILKKLIPALMFAVFILMTAAALRWATHAGLLGEDGGRRSTQILIGLMLAIYANAMPKQIGGAPRSPRAEARTQAALRVGGWSFAVSGLAYAGLWAFAPLAIADLLSMVLVAAAMVLTLSYALWAYTACRSERSASPSH